jgi:hypothetical protein
MNTSNIPQQPPHFNTHYRSHGRMHPEEAAKILGFQPFDIPILISAKLLKPLGNPSYNGSKYFAAVTIMELSLNCEWLDKATKVISKYWKTKMKRKELRPVLQKLLPN